MGWQATVTKKGLEILAGLDNNRVAIVSAAAGTGVVHPDELQEQSALVNVKQNLPVIEDGRAGNKRMLRLQLSNDGLSAGCMLNQIGVYVSVDGGAPVLYYIAQNDEGDAIPSVEAVPNFLAEYCTTLVFSMRSDVVVDCPETAYVTHDALDSKISLLMGIVPIDGGTFFEEYEPFEADGGEF